MGLSAAISLTPVTMQGNGMMEKAYAAEQKQSGITQEEAIKSAQQWVTIPGDYKLEHSSFLDERREHYYGKAVWRLSWEKGRDGHIAVTIDAATGVLMEFSHYSKEREEGHSSQTVSTEQAVDIAQKFLQRVARKEELEKLSRPNEYGNTSPYFTSRLGEHAVIFTRMENGTPFLENGFRLIVGGDGRIFQFQREWYEGVLPDAKEAISLEQAEKLLEERLSPSLVYTRMDRLTGIYRQGNNHYQLVYRYNETDPQLLDAVKGTPLNVYGEPAGPSVQPKALGTTIRVKKESEKVITKEEAQKIAEELIKNLPGSYRSEGSRGSGASTGPDGIARRHWGFDFTPLHVAGEQVEPVELSISDRGKLFEYRANERAIYREDGRKIEKAVPWEQARENALKLVSSLLGDRLGEIYLIERQPSEAAIKEILERGGRYIIRFGWLKDGIPIEGAEFDVSVNPENGEVEWLRARDDDAQTPVGSDTEKIIDKETAKKVEREQKKGLLAYYLPPLWKDDRMSEKREPLLVYRYVGDNGVVNAATGEWLSFDALQQKKNPQDIAEHPAKEALQFAINADLLTVTDGKVEPDKQLTRGEMAEMMARMSNQYEFHNRLRSSDMDEETTPYVFTDVDQKHPLYSAIQKCVQVGLIAKEGKRFEPDRAITRVEAAEMAVRLLGYEELLQKQEIFVSPYLDVNKKMVPAVSLAYAYGLFPTTSAKAFEPDRSLTRAEAAQLMQILQKISKKE
jgi:hypothetical protein